MALAAISSPFNGDDWMYQQISDLNFIVANSITDLTNQSWTIFSSTPVCGFSSSREFLEKLKNCLNNALQSAGMHCVEFSFNIKPFLAFVDRDHDAVEIILSIKQNKQKRIQNYVGIFISRGTLFEKNKNFVRLPVLLCRGPVTLMKSVNSVIEKLFDISISPILFTVRELLCIGFVTILSGSFEDNDTFRLKYKYHHLENSEIFYEINLQNLKDLWLSISNKMNSLSGTEVFHLFYTQIQKHFFRTYGIDLTFFNLKSITIGGNCIVTFDGKIKNKVPETYDFLLKYLTMRIDQDNKVL